MWFPFVPKERGDVLFLSQSRAGGGCHLEAMSLSLFYSDTGS
jgi:hypothetical protein